MEKSELLKDTPKPDAPKYSEEEMSYMGRVLGRLLQAKMDRDSVKEEFDNKTYIQYFNENEKVANTITERDNTNTDLAIQSGTIEQKLLTILSEINILNLTGETRVFDKENNELQELGMALTDIVHQTQEMEGDQEKKLMRQLELLKQGTVFVQDNWVKRWKKVKDTKGHFKGHLKDITWETKLEKIWDGPELNVLYGPGVYLGNIREFEIKKQPFIFTMKITSYEEAKSRYGATDSDNKDIWERWKHVSKERVSVVDSSNLASFNSTSGWTLTELDKNSVEEIHYYDQFNDEYQIFLNGTMMLPVGFPLSAITPNGMFNIEKQVLQVINPFFAYGKSFIEKTKHLSKLLDEMIKLLLLKTRKSIHPPYANISGRVISEKSLMPGAISMGIDPGALVAIGTEGQGATASEYQMLRELREDIDRVTVSPQIQGQAGKSGTTAFEVSLLQKQAQKNLTLIIFASGLLEKKVQWLRTNYVLAYYFEPTGTKIDEVRNEIKSIYRNASVRTNIQGRGSGIRKIIPMQNVSMTPKDVYMEEEYSGTPVPSVGRRKTREELGMEPLQHLYLDVDILKNCKYIFFTEVESKPRDTSTNAKLMFREELKDLQAMQQMGSTVNVEDLQNTYALIWNKRKEKLFGKPIDMAQQIQGQGGQNVLNENSPVLQPEMTGEVA